MSAVYLCTVFLLLWEVRNVHSFAAVGSGNIDSASWINSSLSPESPFESSFNPCGISEVESGGLYEDLACYNECLALNAEIRATYNAFPKYMSSQYLYQICGKMAEGKCSTASLPPVCWCRTPMESLDPRMNTLYNCRAGLHVIRTFISTVTITAKNDILTRSARNRITGQDINKVAEVEAVHMQNVLSSRPPTAVATSRPPTGATKPPKVGYTRSGSHVSAASGKSTPGRSAAPPVPPRRPEASSTGSNSAPEDGCLYTPVQVSGDVVHALVDTGASFSLIHQKFAGPTTASQKQIFGAGGEGFNVFGKTTINLKINGIQIPVTGYVVDRRYKISLGTNFFLAYKAKISIADRKMEIVTSQETMSMRIHYVNPFTTGKVNMMNGRPMGYTSLQVSARLNGRTARMFIDTGSSITIVNREFVYQRIHEVDTTCSVAGSGTIGFLGEAKVNVVIESYKFTIPAHVPEFIPQCDFLTGNEFNERYIELIDYESRIVTFKVPGSSKGSYSLIMTDAYVFQGQ